MQIQYTTVVGRNVLSKRASTTVANVDEAARSAASSTFTKGT